MSKIVVECVQGNITSQEGIDVVVNAANAELRSGGGVAGAIHKAAGPELYRECKPLAPIKTGGAVITKAYELPNKYVVHCLGPVYGVDKPEGKLLADCYINALKIADEKGASSIAFPAISTGIFGYPVQEAAKVAFAAIKSQLNDLKNIKLIRIVLWDRSDFNYHEEALIQANIT
ncbi:MAG TPA: macro domain-containing protein [Bacteroidales bacterium]|nr:macro domain-containing protein [Bacteroidales bacterium]